MTQSKLITFEGIECAGKSTQVTILCEFLKKQNIQFCQTREPGGTEIADALRGLLADKSKNIPPNTELLMMFAARSSHVEQLIRPKLEAGDWVVCDRYVDASYAYQGAGRGIDENIIAFLDQFTTQGLRPDLTFLLDLPIKTMASRLNIRSDEPDRIELEKLEFFERVREKYLERAQVHSDQYVVIDAKLPVGYIESQMIEALNSRGYL